MDYEKVDLLTEIDSLRRGWQACEARLAAVEAERDSLIDQIADAGKKVQALTAERDAARAGEARAVEACSEMENALHGTDLGDHEWDDPIWNALEEMREISRDNSTLDWLAQREREAAAKAEAVAVKFLGNMADEQATGRKLRQPYTTGYADALYHAHDRIQEHFAALRAGKGGE